MGHAVFCPNCGDIIGGWDGDAVDPCKCDTDRCDARGCGRVHGMASFISAFDNNVWCSFHAGKIEAGEGVECRDGDIAHYDETYGLVRIPQRWRPEQELTS